MNPLDGANLKTVLRGSGRDEVLRDLRVTKRDLHQFTRGHVVGQPCLTTLPFTANGISHDETLVGVSLHLNVLGIEIVASIAARSGRVGVHAFKAKIKLRNTWERRQVNSGPDGRVSRSVSGADVIVNQRVRVQSDPMREKRKSPTEIEGAKSCRSEEHTSELQSRQYLVCR